MISSSTHSKTQWNPKIYSWLISRNRFMKKKWLIIRICGKAMNMREHCLCQFKKKRNECRVKKGMCLIGIDSSNGMVSRVTTLGLKYKKRGWSMNQQTNKWDRLVKRHSGKACKTVSSHTQNLIPKSKKNSNKGKTNRLSDLKKSKSSSKLKKKFKKTHSNSKRMKNLGLRLKRSALKKKDFKRRFKGKTSKNK